MKTLRGLDEKPQLLEEIAEKDKDKVLSFRQLAKTVIGRCKADNGEESIDLTQVGLKLKAEGDVGLEDAEFKLLKAKVEKNEAELTALFQGQLLMKIRGSENA